MSENSRNDPAVDATTTGRPPYRRRWFLRGFVLVFVAMLLLVNQYAFTGEALVLCKLWQFYVMEIQALFASSAFGPTASAGNHALVVLLEHVGISFAGGLLSLGFGAFLNRSRGRS